ncbi:MAG: Asp-tRNA(Asn)/Glu-tRNA(Gln) amidotransferase subunit GatA [Fimbriimonadaceae bacterium]
MLTQKSAAELSRLLRKKEVSALEVAEAHLERISRVDPKVGAFLCVCEAEARRMAAEAQRRIDRGEAGPLTGVPFALKDNMSTRDIPTTCASNILRGYVPPYDATVAEKLKAEGMVLLGKVNLDEFAMGGTTETSAFGVTRNPWDLERSPGGSSGGSAAAVAAEMTPLSLGSDTGGSIRQPASLCGLVGFKPTYGRVSRYGLVAFGSSLDQIGPFARTVEDCALMARAISGHCRRDATSLPHPPIDVDSIPGGLAGGDLKGKRFGLPKEMFGEGTAPGVVRIVREAIAKLAARGAVVEEISLPAISYGISTYYIIAPSEASSNLARFDGIRYGPRSDGAGHIGVVERTRADGFGREVKLRIMIGTYALSAGYYDAYYLRAQQVRGLMASQFETALETYDGILSPTSPIPAFKIGEMESDPLTLKLLDYCTIPANLGGFPAISVNAGFDDGLPVGVQLIGKVLSDEVLLQTAYQLEQTFGGWTRPTTLD